MFETHQKLIGKYARANAENMRHVITFVLLTIQQPIDTVPATMLDVAARGIDSPYLWGMKGQGYRYTEANMPAIYADAMMLWDTIPNPIECERQLIDHFARIPGLGIVKAGFVVQLAFGLGGCIDTHNIDRFDLDPKDFKASRYKNGSPKLRAKMLDYYQSILRAQGGAEGLWNSWCEYLYAKYPRKYQSAEQISALHVEALGL